MSPIRLSLALSFVAASISPAFARGDCTLTDLSGNLSGTMTPGGYRVVGSGVQVAAGDTLTIPAGTWIEFLGVVGLEVHGTLLVNGTPESPVVFQGVQDPDCGGPGGWVGLYFGPTSDDSVVNHLTVRDVGGLPVYAVTLDGADIDLVGLTIEDCYAGMNLKSNTFAPTITGCSIMGTQCCPAITDVPLAAVPGFSNNSASGGAHGDYMEVDETSFSGDLVIGADNILNGALVLSAPIDVQEGDSLTLGPDVIFKWQSGGLTVHGELDVNGTPLQPVIFTSALDDSIAGDTLNDGPTSGTAGDVGPLYFGPAADASVVESLVIRYTGNAASIRLDGADVVLDGCVVEECIRGIDLSSNTYGATVTNCSITGTVTTPPIDQVPLTALPGITGNTASLNAIGNYLRVTEASLPADFTLSPEHGLNGVLVLDTNITVPDGVRLSIDPGVLIKTDGAHTFVIEGAMDVAGTPDRPVVITSLTDDEHGGDTNLDGSATQPAAGSSTGGVHYLAGAEASSVENLLVRFAPTAIRSDSPLVAIRSSRVEAASTGFWAVAHAGEARNWVSLDALSTGIYLNSGAFDLVNATSVGSGNFGIRKHSAYAGQVRSSLSFDSGSSDYFGFVDGEIVYSGRTTLVGAGNFDLDPELADVAGGDLTPLPGSPCVEAGDPADADTGLDPNGFSRSLDYDLDGIQRVDVGAHELGNVELSLSGDFSVGGTFFLETSGTAGLLTVMFFSPSPFSTFLPPFGVLGLHPVGLGFAIWPAAPTSVPLSSSTPFTAYLQAAATNGIGGNLSNTMRLEVL